MHRNVLSAALILTVVPGLAFAQTPGSPPAPDSKSPDAAPDNSRVSRNVEYANPDNHPQTLDVFIPPGLAKGEKKPLVVWIHGGGWQAGSKDQCPALPLVREGYVVASINYRLTDVACWPAQIYDCKAAIRYLRAHAEAYHIDTEKVGVWGASAGGHLVAMLGTSGGIKELEGDEGCAEQSSKVQCVCDWFGPSDFTSMQNVDRAAGGAVPKLLGGSLAEKPDVAKAASPVTYCTKDDPPFLIMHGDQDRLVPMQQSELMRDALKKVGVEVSLDVVQGAGHGVGFMRDQLTEVQEFFDKHLKAAAEKGLGEPAPAKEAKPAPAAGKPKG